MIDRIRRLRRHATILVAAVVAYVPVIASSPGQVGADTKTYLYLDPGRLLGEASHLWDSDVALGTVTHQNIGYLWPMGPFYWLFDTLGSPDWFAQRLWLGSLLFAAGAGVWFLMRTLDWRGRGLLVAVLAYELSPYLLHYSARISAVLLPWAGLPWLLAFTIRSARRGGWRDPAYFALVVVTVGSVNATSLLLVGLAPVAWLLHATFAERSLTPARATGAALRIGVLSLGVSLWWIAGLVLQGAYSLPVTRYTETYQTVASASTAPEVMRGLGYWFFYGNDKFGQWIEPSVEYTQGVWLLFLSFGLVVLALLGAALVRWRHRSFFVLLIVMGGLIAVGGHPFDAPSPLGSLFNQFTRTDAGLALRSTPRALPMLVLATAVLLATVVDAVSRRWPAPGRVLGGLVLVAVVLNNPAMWRIRMIEEHLRRDEDLPEYWLEAADALDADPSGGRVMEVPGTDFASYRWGNTVDPITPGLIHREYVARELVPFGSPESAALLVAFDRRLQEDSLDPDSIVPIAELLSVGDIVHRADLTYERFRTPRPVPTADLLDNRSGLGDGVGYGPAVPNVAGPEQPMLDEVQLAIDPSLPDPSPVTVYPVPDPLPVVRQRSMTGPTVVVGDAEGVVDAAGAELLDPERPLWFGADLAIDAELRSDVLAEPARVVITDTNKRRASRWGTLRENAGFVERAGQEPLEYDPTDARLELFPDVAESGTDPDDTRTVSLQQAPFALRASDYGNPVTYTNDDRPAYAIDGDTDTAWVVSAFAEARGERLEFTYAEPAAVPEIRFVQPQVEANRHITEVSVRADGELLATAALDERSLAVDGQTVVLPEHDPARVYVIEITDLDLPEQPTYPGVSAVGFAEVQMGDAAPVEESLRTPVAFVRAMGHDLDRHEVDVVLTRQRSNPQEPVRKDPEAEIHRTVVLPVDRTFTIGGAARLSAAVEEPMVDALIGRDRTVGGVGATSSSSGRLPGDLSSAASFAFDADPTSAWTGEFGPQAGQWVELRADAPIAFDGITVGIMVDSLHSVPAALRVIADGVDLGVYDTNVALDDGARGTVETVVLPVEGRARDVRIEIASAHERATRDWYSGLAVAMPVSIAEVGIAPDAHFGAPADVDSGCVPMVEIDGRTAEVRVTGTAADALARRELTITGCAPVSVTAGEFTVDSAARRLGIDADQLVLSSPRDLTPPAAPGPVEVLDHDDTSYRLAVDGSDHDRWLVLGQSHNDGWEARVDGRSLGPPRLIDGFANGWLLPAGEAVEVVLEWTPQRLVRWALGASVLAVVAVLALALFARRRDDDAPAPRARLDGPSRPALRPLPGIDEAMETVRGPWVAAVGAGAATAVFAWLNLPRLPAAALLVGLVAAIGVRRRATWTVPALLAAVVFGLTALAIMVEQRRFRYPPDFGWPGQFADLHVYGVLCLVLLAADYVVSVLRPESGPGR